jgi:hypothetical protein
MGVGMGLPHKPHSSWPDLIRASMQRRSAFRREPLIRMDCRVKPGNDESKNNSNALAKMIISLAAIYRLFN